MQFTITHEGVPVGIVALKETGEYMIVPVVPLPAYESVRKSVRAASIALADVALSAVQYEWSTDRGRILT